MAFIASGKRVRAAGLLLLVLARPAGAAFCPPPFPDPLSGPLPSPAAPPASCQAAIAAAEARSGLPPGLMLAIARVESGRREPGSEQLAPWPWTANIEGDGAFYASKQEAIEAVRQAQRAGARSIDVGCMQVNLLHHPEAFASLEQAFDPAANTAYAARFLRDLHEQAGDWGRAAGLYHSATPALAAEYQRKVLAAWHQGEGATPDVLPRVAAAGPASPFGAPGARGRFDRIAAPASTLPSTGKGLDAYRAMPVRTAAFPLVRSGR